MAEEFEKYAILKNMFRRRSSTEFTQGSFKEIVDEKQMGSLLDQMGAHVEQTELHDTIQKMAPENQGKLTFDQYTKLCDTFVKDPTAVSTAMEFRQLHDFET
jgi:Ca2+-binding EF-hand superfamily protein